MLREAMVVCPKADNAGHSLATVKQLAMNRMVAEFGGVTVREAQGAWADDTGKLYVEPVYELVSAMEVTEANDATLRDIAKRIGKDGRQLAVYCRYANGAVEIIDTTPAQERLAA